MSKICDFCGEDLPDSAVVCSLCKNPVPASSSTIQAKPAQSSPAQQPLQPLQPQQQYIPPVQQPQPAQQPQPVKQQVSGQTNAPAFNQIIAFARKKPLMLASMGVALLVVCILIGVLASGGGRSAIVGKWDYDMSASEGPPMLLYNSIEFASDGTLRYSQGYGFQDAGTWSVNKGELIVVDGGYKGFIDYSVHGNTLILSGNWKIVYTKSK